MEPDVLIKKYKSLSSAERREVLIFIDFLKNRKRRLSRKLNKVSSDFGSEEFVGMWKGRMEMDDSTAWVKNLRRSDWTD